MLEQFYPREWVDSIDQIPWDLWYEKGMRGVIFDIDNTLVPHGEPADEQVIGLFVKLHGMGWKTYLLSNNKEPRVASFAARVASPYTHKAGKPGVKNYLKAVGAMETSLSTTLFVGDQLFTDVYGANRAGIYGILVKPIHPREEIQIVLKRYLEAIVLYFYKKNQRRDRKQT